MRRVHSGAAIGAALALAVCNAGASSRDNAKLKAFGGGTVEAIPGLGKASLWVEKIAQLQTLIVNSLMVMVTVTSGPGAKEKAIALAKRAGA